MTTRQEKIEEWKRIAAETFANHVARHEVHGPFTTIVWRRPKSSNWYVRYVVDHDAGLLYVSGDIGEEIYRWSGEVTLPFLAHLDFSYFRSKSQCQGRNHRQWEGDVCLELAFERLRVRADGKYDKPSRWPLLVSSPELAAFQQRQRLYGRPVTDKLPLQDVVESVERMVEATRDQHEWEKYLGDNGYEVFGDEFYEINGWVPSILAVGHWVGLRSAIQQVLSGEKKEKPHVDRS